MAADPFDLLGRSLIADEYKGDFATALRAAEHAVGSARDQRALGRALLVRAAVEMLAGSSGAALDTLEAIFGVRTERETADLVYWVAGLAHAEYAMGGISGALRIAPEMSSFLQRPRAGREGHRWRPRPVSASAATWDTVPSARAATPSEPLLGDGPVWLLLSALATRAWFSSLPVPGQPNRGPASALALYDTWATQNADAGLDAVARWARLDGRHSARAFQERVKAEFARRAGDTGGGHDLLDAAYAYYLAERDTAGMAACALTRGDWQAAPGSSPLLLGLLSGQPAEGLLGPRFTEVSETAYEQALRFFGDAEALFAEHPRGRAAVQLRYAYLAGRRDDLRQASELCWSAMNAFEDCGDERGKRIAWLHATLYRLAAGIPVDVNAVAEDLVGWAGGRGSPALVFHLADLANAWGLYLLEERGDPQAALRCHGLAIEIYHGLGAVVSEATSHVFTQSIHTRVGQLERASLAAERAVMAVEPALSATHPLLAQTATALPGLVGTSLLEPHIAALDGDGLSRAIDRVRPLLHRLDALTNDTAPTDAHTTLAELAEAVAVADDPDIEAFAESAASHLMGIAKSLRPWLASEIKKAELHVPWFFAIASAREGYWSSAQRDLENLLITLQADAAPEARELEPYVLMSLCRWDEAVAAFQRVIDETGFPPYFTGLRWLETAHGKPDGDRLLRHITARSRLLFLASAEHFHDAYAAVDELEHLYGPTWWKFMQEPWTLLERAASAAAHVDKPIAADRFYRQAIEELESQRLTGRDSLLVGFHGIRGNSDVYASASRWAVTRHDTLRSTDAPAAQRYAEESFMLSERGRARATTALLAATAAQPDAHPLFTAWRAADARATVCHNQLHLMRSKQNGEPSREAVLVEEARKADEQLADVERRLARRSPLLLQPAVVRDDPELISRIAAHIPEDGALLAFRIYADTLLTWAITRGGLIAARQRTIDSYALSEDIRLLRDACVKFTDAWSAHADAIAETLLAPIDQLIAGYRRILVVPSGSLHRLPFHMLPWRGQPLVATHEISYLPTASFITRPAPVTNGASTAAVFGNPAAMRWPDGSEALNLRWAEREAEQVAQITGVAALTGSAVTKAAVLRAMGECDLVHVASHGYFDAGAPLHSAVLLADGAALTAADLTSATITASLVTLTGCSTASGAATFGEDVIGIARAVLTGGAAAAAVTLWDAYGGPTAELVTDVYRRVRAGESATLALRGAQDAMRLGGYGTVAQHPGCWAPLVVIGHPGT